MAWWLLSIGVRKAERAFTDRSRGKEDDDGLGDSDRRVRPFRDAGGGRAEPHDGSLTLEGEHHDTLVRKQPVS